MNGGSIIFTFHRLLKFISNLPSIYVHIVADKKKTKMAISDLLNRRVRAQAKDEDDNVYSEASASASGSEDERDDKGSDQDSEGEDDVDEGSSADMVSRLSRYQVKSKH